MKWVLNTLITISCIILCNSIKVPTKINQNPFVTGQDQHFGTRAPPRELQLENSVMPPDPGVVRVQVVYKFYKNKLALNDGCFDHSLLSCLIKKVGI